MDMVCHAFSETRHVWVLHVTFPTIGRVRGLNLIMMLFAALLLGYVVHYIPAAFGFLRGLNQSLTAKVDR